MLKNNVYNVDKEFDYSTIKAAVIKSLEKIVKEEALKKRSNIISNSQGTNALSSVSNVLSPPSHLKLKIRNTTKYLMWRLAVLERDSFTCQICHTSMKYNKKLRLEVHHAKTFNDIYEENKITTVEKALACEELWNLNNGVSICYSCHKDVEKLRAKLRNIFIVRDIRKSYIRKTTEPEYMRGSNRSEPVLISLLYIRSKGSHMEPQL
jgi:5-methylcytosine-specific restriction endonuclease McrA